MELNVFGLVVLGAVLALPILLGLAIPLSGRSPSKPRAMHRVLLKAGWLLPLGICAFYMAAWLIDIVIPTLKGADFNELYDQHGIRYLDIALVSFVIGFVWLAFVHIRGATVTSGILTREQAEANARQQQ